MDEKGHICLTDFGMAKILKKNEVALSFCGTPEYLSPEIISGIGHNFSCDWWALGVFTYEMLFVTPAFYSENQEQMFNMIQKNPLKFPQNPKISNEGYDFILRCCIKNPKERLGSKPDGSEDIELLKKHPWFKDINWDKLLKKEIDPPFIPHCDGEKYLNNFDPEFLEEAPINSLV